MSTDDLLEKLLEELRKPPLSKTERRRLHKKASELIFRSIDERRPEAEAAGEDRVGSISYGEAVAEVTGPEAAIDGQATWQLAKDGSSKNDLDTMLRCCIAELAKYRATGRAPAPFYFDRVAILLSKAKRHDEEIRILEGVLEHMPEDAVGARFITLRERLPKTRKKAGKETS